MTHEEKIRLYYRRQYILAPEKINCPYLHNCFEILNRFYLYTHIDLITTDYSTQHTRLILLGEMFDFETPEKQNIDILKDITDPDYNKVLENTAKYTGRFVLIHVNLQQIRIMHDLTSTRKVFYYISDKGLWCSSQAQLLARLNKLDKTSEESKKRFYNSEVHKALNYSNIGNLTIYDEVFQLLPNHYLDLNNNKISRYWLNKDPENLSLIETVDICVKILSGYLKAINLRYDIMLPLTAGKDSRTLLAATQEIKDSVYYYINKEKCLKRNCNDIRIPQKLTNKLGLSFHVLNPYIKMDKDFEEIYYSNNEFASPYYLPHIYNYYKNFPDKVNLPGNFVASAYDMYGKKDKSFNSNNLAKLNWVNSFQFAVSYYQKWLDESYEFRMKYKIHIPLLFYMEERLANWGTQVHSDKDIAQEDIVPFNSRLLTHYFLSVQPKLIDRPYFSFFIMIMKKLWPEVVSIPINPSFKKFVFKVLYHIRVLDFIRNILYKRQ